jgi:hypothetical protein
MHTPFRSESDAFRFTLGGTGIVAVSVLVGELTDPWVGLGVFSLGVVVSATRYLYVARRDRRAVLQEAATESVSQKSARRRRHVLVVANQPLAGSDLRERILERYENLAREWRTRALATRTRDARHARFGRRRPCGRACTLAGATSTPALGPLGEPKRTPR